MLTGHEIRNMVAAGYIVIRPFDEDNLGPNSYDVRLDSQLVVYDEVILDPRRKNRCHTIHIPESGLVLQPGRLYLGRTIEYTESPSHIPMYDGRSSLGRLGVASHVTAGFGDLGFRGRWTLELSVVQPVWVYPGMRIGQLSWHNPDGMIMDRYHGKYQGQEDVQPSRMFEDREWREETMANMICTRSECVDTTRICGDCEHYKAVYDPKIYRLVPINEEEANKPCKEPEQEPWTRQRVLKEAEKCVCGGREQDYGTPEDSFRLIAQLWESYIRETIVGLTDVCINPEDVAVMMALLKIARLAYDPKHMDSWVDLAGYAACGGEIAGKQEV